MKKAFTYMFDDENIAKKLLVLFGINLIAYFIMTWFRVFPTEGFITLLLCITALTAGIISTGYGISCVKSFIKNEQLPYIDFTKNALLGLKFILAILITAVTIFACSIIFYLLMKLLFLPIQIILAIFYTVIFFVFLFYSLGLSRNFAQTEHVLSYLQLKKVTAQIKNNKTAYLKAFGYYILFTIVMSVLNYLVGQILIFFVGFKSINILILSLFNSLFTTYTIFVSSYLVANSMAIEENE